MAVITPDRHYSVTESNRREKTPLPPFDPEIHGRPDISPGPMVEPAFGVRDRLSFKIPMTRTRVVFGDPLEQSLKPTQNSLPKRPSRLTRFVKKSGEWLQTKAHNKYPKPALRRGLGAFAVKAEEANQNIQRKTREFFDKPRRVIGAIALVGVLAGGAGVVSAMDKSVPERSQSATELTDLGHETAAVDEVTDSDRIESWVNDHPGASIEDAFDSLAQATDFELQLVYDQEVENVINGVYGPYNGEFPDWLQ